MSTSLYSDPNWRQNPKTQTSVVGEKIIRWHEVVNIAHSCVIPGHDFHLNLTVMFPVLVPSFQTNFSSYVSNSNLAEEVSRAPLGEPRAIYFLYRSWLSKRQRYYWCYRSLTGARVFLRVGGRVGFFLCACALLLPLLSSSRRSCHWTEQCVSVCMCWCVFVVMGGWMDRRIRLKVWERLKWVIMNLWLIYMCNMKKQLKSHCQLPIICISIKEERL